MSAAHAFDLSPLPVFTKWEWDDHLDDHGGLIGACRLVRELRRSCGTASPAAHIPAVWRLDKHLMEACEWSPNTFRRWRDALAEAGMLFEIASGRGNNTTIKILKMADWTELEALRVAERALHGYASRTGHDLRWQLRAVEQAIEDREIARTATVAESAPAEPEIEQRSDTEGPSLNNCGIPLYTRELPPDSEQKESECDESRDATPASATPKKGGSGREVVDFDHLRGLRKTWLQLFAAYGRELDPGAAMRLARAFAGLVEEPAGLLEGGFVGPSGRFESLDGRLMRLLGDGTTPGKACAFILADLEGWHGGLPPGSTAGFSGRSAGRDPSRSVGRNDYFERPRPQREPAEPGTEGHFLELVARFEADGMGWLAAVGAAEVEFEARGWEIPT